MKLNLIEKLIEKKLTSYTDELLKACYLLSCEGSCDTLSYENYKQLVKDKLIKMKEGDK